MINKQIRSPKVLPAESIQSGIEKNYRLTCHELPQLLDGGVENGAWLLHANKGEYIAKLFAEGEKIMGKVEEEVLLYDYLRKHGIHAPEVLPTENGKLTMLIKIDADSYPTIVMKFEQLKHMPPNRLTKAQLTNIAATIATMHKVTGEYPRRVNIRITDVAIIHTLSASDFDNFLQSPNAALYSPQELSELRNIHQKAFQYLEAVDLDHNLTTAVLHGDLQLGHMQFLPNGEIYIFDFSDFAYGPVSLDLAVFLCNFYRESDMSFAKWHELNNNFLQAFETILPLATEDKKALQIFMVSKMLEQIRYLNNISIKTGKEVDTKGNKKRYELMEYLLQNI